MLRSRTQDSTRIESLQMSHGDKKTRPVIVSSAGGLLSLALHLLLMTPVLIGLGTSTKSLHVDSSEIGRPAEDDSPSSSMTVSFIDDPDGGSGAESDPPSDGRTASPPLSSVPFPTPAPSYNLPSVQEDTDQAQTHPSEAGQSDPGRQLLFGRYMGQITARIERAWMRPRTPIDDAAFFACRVRVTQDRNGVVQEIELVRCNGTHRWQTSLVQAIQSASPLPAPPDADVFRPEVMLDLQSATFAPGSSVEGFEPDTRASASGATSER